MGTMNSCETTTYDEDALAAINCDQIVTATDRLLFGNARARISQVNLARGSVAKISRPRPAKRALMLLLGALACSIVFMLVV